MDDVVLLDRQLQPGSDADLLADHVDAGDLLGDGVLHLDRVFISMKYTSPSASRNSTVPAFS